MSEWRLIREGTRSGDMNMALDEVAAETASERGLRTLRVYRWDPSTLTLGYGQEYNTIDWDYCEQEDITVTRRPTGGGAIYHDNHGDISYSIITPAADFPSELLQSYKEFCTPILKAFENMGIEGRFAEAERPAIHEPACYLQGLHPVHDIVAADGRKISGNAQYRQRESIIQHGSLTYETTPDRHCSVFSDAPSVVDFRNRVTSIREQSNCSRSEAVGILETALKQWGDEAEVESWTETELSRAREIAENKYSNPAWNRDGIDQI